MLSSAILLKYSCSSLSDPVCTKQDSMASISFLGLLMLVVTSGATRILQEEAMTNCPPIWGVTISSLAYRFVEKWFPFLLDHYH